jgi:hypothetical protein
MMAERQQPGTDRVQVTTRSAEDQAPGATWYELSCAHWEITGYVQRIHALLPGMYQMVPLSRALIVNSTLSRMRLDGTSFPGCGCWERLVCQYGHRLEVGRDSSYLTRN